MIRLKELKAAYLNGLIEKKLYWQIAREDYTHILPELQNLVSENGEVESIEITKEGCILKNRGGVKLLFDFQQAICRAEADLLLEGDPEKNDLIYIGKYLNERKSGSVLDIGANVGIFSLNLYQNYPDIQYYLFEPIPSTFQWLLKNMKLNSASDERYKPFNVGMSDKKGTFEFYVPAANEAASLVANEDSFYRKKADSNGNYTGNTDLDRVLCTVDTVDSFVKEHNVKDITFVKIDVEGNEFKVLKGAEETLKEYKPLVYCELLRKHAKRFGYHPNEVIEYMSKLGYGCLTMREGKLVDIKEITEETEETNFFFSTDCFAQ